jgi:cytochrome c556
MRYTLIGCFAFTGLIFAADYQPVASTKQLMIGISKPAMDGLAQMSQAGGPKDDKEWEKAASWAAALGESAELLTLGNRAKDKEGWASSSQQLHQASLASIKAAQSKDVDAWKASISPMGAACKSCHSVHRKKH